MTDRFDAHDERLAARLKALAHPARLWIVDVLAARGPCICGEIVEVLPLAQATVSQHLKILKDAGLLRGAIDGPRSCYCLDADAVRALRRDLDDRLGRVEDGCCTDPPHQGDHPMTVTADIKSVVRARYGAIAESRARGCGCAPDTCGDRGVNMIGDGYVNLEGYVAGADLGLGCGVPTRHAGIREGDVVLDLGSGAGIDAFVARRIVGARGRVIGVDMTEAMIERARTNAAKLGYGNVEFRFGEIEELPVRDDTVDVVISNCVLNLVPDKPKAFAETLRVLRPGGHFCVSDIVSTGTLPDGIRRAAALYVGCVAGAMSETDYLEVIRDTGFGGVAMVERRPISLPDEVLHQHLSDAELAAFRASGIGLLSVTVVGAKPEACRSEDCCP